MPPLPGSERGLNENTQIWIRWGWARYWILCELKCTEKKCCINQETQGLLGRCTHACSSREGNMKKHEGLTSLLWRGFIHFSSKIGTDSSIAGGSTFWRLFLSFLLISSSFWACTRWNGCVWEQGKKEEGMARLLPPPAVREVRRVICWRLRESWLH